MPLAAGFAGMHRATRLKSVSFSYFRGGISVMLNFSFIVAFHGDRFVRFEILVDFSESSLRKARRKKVR